VKGFWHRLSAVGASVFMAAGLWTLLSVSGAAPASAAAVINVGFECSCTGAQSSSTEVAKAGALAWASQVNAAGGVDGHQVHIIYEDDQSNSGTGLAQVETMINQDHVVAILDAAASDPAWASVATAASVPVLGGGSSQIYVTNPNFFAVGGTLDGYFDVFVDAAKKVGAKSVAELYCAESPICQQAVTPLKIVAGKRNMPVDYVTSISYSAPNFTAQCLAAKQAGAQALIIADAVAVVASVMNSCTQQGYTPWEISLDGAISGSFTKDPGLTNKLIGAEPDMPFFLHNSATASYDSAINKYQSAVLKDPNYGEETLQYYAAGEVVAAAIKAAHAGQNGATVTAAETKAGLYDLHGITLNGLVPPLTYHKGTVSPVDCWYWVRTQGGKFTTPYGTAPFCFKPTPLT